MASKNETPALIAALLITLGLLSGLFWWFTRQNPNLSDIFGSSDSPSSQSSQPTSGSQFSDVDNVPTGLFNYGGSTTWAPIRRDVDAAIQAAIPGFQLRYTDPLNATPGSGSGIRMLLEGQLSFAQSSRPLTDAEYQQAQQRGFALQQIPVALEGLAIAVNPDLPIAGLTIAQIQSIYTGRVTNWRELGGPDLEITPFTRRVEDGGTVEFFVANVLNGQPLGSNATYVYDTTDALRKLAETPGGIYYASAPEVVPQCTVKPLPIARQGNDYVAPYRSPLVLPENCPNQRNQLNIDAFRSGDYPITRQLFVVVKMNGGLDQQAGEAYANLLLTAAGQDLIEQAGFVRLR